MFKSFGAILQFDSRSIARDQLLLLIVLVIAVLIGALTLTGHYRAMLGLEGLSLDSRGDGRPIVILLGLAIVLLMPTSQQLVEHWLRPSRWIAAAVGAILVTVLLQIGIGANQEFIYFQF
mgnify:CR=1 FL=1